MLKKELQEELINASATEKSLRSEIEFLRGRNQTLENFINQLRNKLQESVSQLSQYERTLGILSARIQEKDALIKEQQVENNRRNDE